MPHANPTQADGGVLLIELPDALDPQESREGRAIVAQLMDAAEQRRESLSLVLVGYKHEIEGKLYAWDAGFKGRFKDIEFDDFSEAQVTRPRPARRACHLLWPPP